MRIRVTLMCLGAWMALAGHVLGQTAAERPQAPPAVTGPFVESSPPTAPAGCSGGAACAGGACGGCAGGTVVGCGTAYGLPPIDCHYVPYPQKWWRYPCPPLRCGDPCCRTIFDEMACDIRDLFGGLNCFGRCGRGGAAGFGGMAGCAFEGSCGVEGSFDTGAWATGACSTGTCATGACGSIDCGGMCGTTGCGGLGCNGGACGGRCLNVFGPLRPPRIATPQDGPCGVGFGCDPSMCCLSGSSCGDGCYQDFYFEDCSRPSFNILSGLGSFLFGSRSAGVASTSWDCTAGCAIDSCSAGSCEPGCGIESCSGCANGIGGCVGQVPAGQVYATHAAPRGVPAARQPVRYPAAASPVLRHPAPSGAVVRQVQPAPSAVVPAYPRAQTATRPASGRMTYANGSGLAR